MADGCRDCNGMNWCGSDRRIRSDCWRAIRRWANASLSYP